LLDQIRPHGLVRNHAQPSGGLRSEPTGGEVHGVGPKTTLKMHALGIETGADLRRQTLDFLQRNFGKAGSWYYEIARGQDQRPVQAARERKFIGIGNDFLRGLD